MLIACTQTMICLQELQSVLMSPAYMMVDVLTRIIPTHVTVVALATKEITVKNVSLSELQLFYQY